MKDHPLPSSRAPFTPPRPAWGMAGPDQQRIAEWIGDAFAILCVRISSLSASETKLRLGFESILRQLGTSPLQVIVRAAPPAYGAINATQGDLRNILKALDSCLRTFRRYESVLNPAQRRIQILVRATRRWGEEELCARLGRVPAPELATTAA